MLQFYAFLKIKSVFTTAQSVTKYDALNGKDYDENRTFEWVLAGLTRNSSHQQKDRCTTGLKFKEILSYLYLRCNYSNGKNIMIAD